MAFLGDNPMQSEMACHIGLNGNLPCRICLVAGAGAGDEEYSGVDHVGMGVTFGGHDSEREFDESDNSDVSIATSGKGKEKEVVQETVKVRIKANKRKHRKHKKHRKTEAETAGGSGGEAPAAEGA